MRFMLLMIPGGYGDADPGTVPDAEGVATMMKFNEKLLQAGVLRGAEGLHPPSMGARVTFPGGAARVTDGPFPEAKEVLGGFWIIDVKSKDEAIEWAKQIPGSANEVVEIRQIQEMEDFPQDVRDAAAGFEQMQTRQQTGAP